MSIETDESLWPEGAQWYGPETKYHNACFYKQDEDGHWWICFGTTVSAWSLTGPNVPRKMGDLIPRPTAPWPQVGVECEFSPGPGSWLPCKVIGKYEGFVWLIGANGPVAYCMTDIKFRPICTLRDELAEVMRRKISGTTELLPWETLADAVMDEFDLTRKQK